MKSLLYIAGLEALLLGFSGCSRPARQEQVVQRETQAATGRVYGISSVRTRYRLRESKNVRFDRDYELYYVTLMTPVGVFHTVLYPTDPRFRIGQRVSIPIQPLPSDKMTVKDFIEKLSSNTCESDDTTCLSANSIFHNGY